MQIIRLFMFLYAVTFVGNASAQPTNQKIQFREVATVRIGDFKGVGPWYNFYEFGDRCWVRPGHTLVLKSRLSQLNQVVAEVETANIHWFWQMNSCPEYARVYLDEDIWQLFFEGNGKRPLAAR